MSHPGQASACHVLQVTSHAAAVSGPLNACPAQTAPQVARRRLLATVRNHSQSLPQCLCPVILIMLHVWCSVPRLHHHHHHHQPAAGCSHIDDDSRLSCIAPSLPTCCHSWSLPSPACTLYFTTACLHSLPLTPPACILYLQCSQHRVL
jgi:hypothetical protein